MEKIILLTFGIVAIIALLIFLIVVPKETKHFHLSEDAQLDKTLQKIVNLLGGDILTFVDKTRFKPKTYDQRLEELIATCGNPWNLTIVEFQIVRFVLSAVFALIGLTLGIIISVSFVHGPVAILIPLITAPLLGYLGYLYPESNYEGLKKKRDEEFKRYFPEAIDYLIMIIGSGTTLTVAFERSVEYLEEGAVKEEFKKIVSELHSGQSLEKALNNFASRVPSESIKAFCKSLNNANKLNVDLKGILEARSDASRRELEQEIEKRISTLDTKVMMCLSPTALVSILIVVMSPTAVTLMNSF